MNLLCTKFGKIAVLAIAVVVTLFVNWYLIANENNTLPIDRILAAENSVPDNQPHIGTEPELLILKVSPLATSDPQHRYLQMRLAFLNPTAHRLDYVGYTMNSYQQHPPRGEIHPWYVVHSMIDGSWQPKKSGRCGVGRGQLAVPPGEAGHSDAHAEDDGHPIRIGFPYRWVDRNGNQKETTIWSKEISSESLHAQQAASANDVSASGTTAQ